MEVSKSRVIERIDKVASFNSLGPGINRFTYSENDGKVKQWLRDICEGMGLKVTVDAVGNFRARLEGRDPSLAPLWIGSHLDSVPNGGRYDGILGVIGALEVLTVMHENGYVPGRSIELIVFAEEEGTNFGTTMVGSKSLVGKLSYEDLQRLKNSAGKSCADMARESGLSPENVGEIVLKSGDVFAMMELHIEQGIVLDRMGLKLGVEEAIAGMTTLTVKVKGESNHAGATPMNMRADPMQAAALLITEIEKIAKEKCNDTTVATVGTISCIPNAPNVIAKEVNFTIDVRDIVDSGIESAISGIKDAAAKIEAERGVEIIFGTIGSNKPVSLSEKVVSVIESSVTQCTDLWMRMNSGAVHDSEMMTFITDVGMIFVPSVNGKSHNPEEYTKPEDLALGCQALLLASLKLTE